MTRIRKSVYPCCAALLASALLILVAIACGSKEETESSATIDSLATTGAMADSAPNVQFEVSSDESLEEEQPAEPEHQPEPKGEVVKPKTQPKPKEPATVTVEIPSGTALPITLSVELETGKVLSGDSFTGTLDQAVVVNGREIFPAGATVEGVVTNAVASGRLKTEAELAITISSIDGHAVTSTVITEKAASHASRNKKIIGGGAVVGGLLGALKGKDLKGAMAGAAIGAAAGVGAAALTGKQDIKYTAGTQLQFTIAEPTSVTMPK